MKKRQNNFARASALQITLSAALISISAVLLTAASFEAAPAANELSASVAPDFGNDRDLASESWTVTGSLNTKRSLHTATLLLNGKVLVAGGEGSDLPDLRTRSAELYDPASGGWTNTGKLNTGREYHTATLLPNGKVLVAGGKDGGAYAGVGAELYDPASGLWTATGSLYNARSFHTATLLHNGQVLVAGGMDTRGFAVRGAELYDPASGSWTATGSLATARGWYTATLLPNGKVLVAGGEGKGSGVVRLTSAELYDPASGSWAATGSLNTARAAHTATLLPNGKVLVAGGYGNAWLSSAELYDPASGSWTATGNLNTARHSQTATLLPNGKVLVAGGVSFGTVIIPSAELYDPASASWTATGSLNTARQWHTATLLPDIKVLVAGGIRSTIPISNAELYNTPELEICFVCHRHEVTLPLACGDLEYQRHLEHGTHRGRAQRRPQKVALRRNTQTLGTMKNRQNNFAALLRFKSPSRPL